MARVRLYEGEGHEVQYRHFDQILVDMAGMGDEIVVCRDGKAELVKEDEELGEATLGLCAWQTAR